MTVHSSIFCSRRDRFSIAGLLECRENHRVPQSLSGSIEHYLKAGDPRLTVAMAELLAKTEKQLKDAGIENVRSMVASLQREQVKMIMQILAGEAPRQKPAAVQRRPRRRAPKRS